MLRIPIPRSAGAELPSLERTTNVPVFISYPKSGRTWFRYIFDLAGINVSFEHARRGGTPKFEVADGRRGIFLYRYPIDSAVSHYFYLNHYKLRLGTARHLKATLKGTLPPRDLRAFLDSPQYGVSLVCQYVRAWLDYLESHREIITITYEDMRANPVATLRRVLDHIDPGGNHDVAALVEQSTFERMRATEDSGDRARELRLGHKRKSDPDSRIVRKGKMGGYRDYLSPPEQMHYEEICAEFGFSLQTQRTNVGPEA